MTRDMSGVRVFGRSRMNGQPRIPQPADTDLLELQPGRMRKPVIALWGHALVGEGREKETKAAVWVWQEIPNWFHDHQKCFLFVFGQIALHSTRSMNRFAASRSFCRSFLAFGAPPHNPPIRFHRSSKKHNFETSPDLRSRVFERPHRSASVALAQAQALEAPEILKGRLRPISAG